MPLPARIGSSELATHPEFLRVGRALALQGETRRLARSFEHERIDVLYLAGPDLQHRLYGSPAEHWCSYVDLLVRERNAKHAGEVLRGSGWRSVGMTPVRTFAKDGYLLHLVSDAGANRRLYRGLWSGAAVGESGMLEPQFEPLLVFLAAQIVPHDFESQHHLEDAAACWQLSKRATVWRIARRARAVSPLYELVGSIDVEEELGRLRHREALKNAALAIRWDRLIPATLHGRIREAAALRREGFGLFSRLGTRDRVVIDGLTLEVAKGVFSPWPEGSAAIVAACVGMTGDRVDPVLVEVGTGSGAVALDYFHQRRQGRVIGTDISFRAVACARRNRDRLGLRGVRVVHSDLLSALPKSLAGRVDIIVGNLPYLRPDVGEYYGRWPVASLVGHGENGLGLHRTLADQAAEVLTPGGALVIQCMDWQWAILAEHLEGAGFGSLAAKPIEPQGASRNKIVVGTARRTGPAPRSLGGHP